MTSPTRIGPRMYDLLWIIAQIFDGRAPSRSAAYRRLNYHGRESNYYGSAVMNRLERHGLVRRLPNAGAAVPVELTDAGRAALALRD